MIVQELRDLLEDMDAGDELRIAYQPSWPLAAHVAGLATRTSDVVNHPCQHCGASVHLEGDEAHHLSPAKDDDHEPVLGEVEGEEERVGGRGRLACSRRRARHALRAARCLRRGRWLALTTRIRKHLHRWWGCFSVLQDGYLIAHRHRPTRLALYPLPTTDAYSAVAY